MSRAFETLLPPPVESMAVAYFKPLLTPVPVATRLPEPDKSRDTVNGFLRVEAAGGAQVDEDLFFNVQIILHGYSPDEVQAEEIVGNAIAWGANASGLTTRINNRDWYVAYSRVSALATKQQDPLVNLPRYRAMVQWRIPGNPLV